MKGNFLYRYLTNEQKFKQGWDHNDPYIEDFSYGEGGGFTKFVENNIEKGSRVFFFKSINCTRYITAMYFVDIFGLGSDLRKDTDLINNYKSPHLHHPNFTEHSDVWYDFLIFGDRNKSINLEKKSIELNKEILINLDFLGKPIKWGIVDKNGNLMNDKKCMNVCLRTPRLISDADADYLEELCRSRL